MKQSNYRTIHGITLFEILVSFAIISILFVGILSFYSSSLRQGREIDAKLRAKYIVEEEIERLKSLKFKSTELAPYNNLTGQVEYFEKDGYLVKIKKVFINPTTGTIKEPYPIEESENTRLIEVTVSAVRQDGLGGQVDVVAYISP